MPGLPPPRHIPTLPVADLWKGYQASDLGQLVVSSVILFPQHARARGAQSSEGGKMSILGWIVLGLIAGFIASKIVESRGQGLFLNIPLGIIGGMVGGWLFERFGET